MDDVHPVNRSPMMRVALRAGYWICVLIAVGAVVRRLVVLAAGSPDAAALDAVFASRTALTLAHIVPALVFVAITPFVLFGARGNRHWPERILFPIGVSVGMTAYAMSSHAIGGWIERSAVLFFNTLFLISLLQAWRFQRDRHPGRERRWLLRAIAILLGIATTRPIVGLFFATRSLTHLEPAQFFGLAFWIGFSINTAVVEWWLSRPWPAPAPHAARLAGYRTTP